jgi:hypothetical protein
MRISAPSYAKMKHKQQPCLLAKNNNKQKGAGRISEGSEYEKQRMQ